MFNQLKKRGSILTGHNRNAQINKRREYLLKQRQQIILQQQKLQQQKLQQQNFKRQHQMVNLIKKELYLIFNNNEIISNEIEKNNEVAYIILYSENDRVSDYYRLRNIYYTLLLTSKLFNFNIYITEIGVKQSNSLKKVLDKFKNFNIKHNFILNNTKYFDRGHGFNCTIKHFIDKEEILIMGDSDIPLHKNISKLINHIKLGTYHFISPYTTITKLTENNTKKYYENQILNKSDNKSSNLYTISGGILIASRKIFENLGLWFEYLTYGNEDRALDVILLEKYKDKTFIDNYNYIHLWHPRDNIDNDYYIIYNNIRYSKETYHKILFNCSNQDNDRKSMHSKCKHNRKEIWGDEYNKQKKGFLNKYINLLV
jgi:hypothetical protein